MMCAAVCVCFYVCFYVCFDVESREIAGRTERYTKEPRPNSPEKAETKQPRELRGWRVERRDELASLVSSLETTRLVGLVSRRTRLV